MRQLSSIEHLPEELLMNHIFGKLPVWIQSEARAVSKDWNSKISRSVGKYRAKEGWIVVRAGDTLRWYNVNQGRWLSSTHDHLPAECLPAYSVCVSGEVFLIPHGGCLFSWNAVTGETRTFRELNKIPGQGFRFIAFGVYADNESTGNLKLVGYTVTTKASDRPGVHEQDEKGSESWKEILAAHPTLFSAENSSAVIPCNDTEGYKCMFDVEKRSFTGTVTCPEVTRISFSGPSADVNLFHFEAHGSYKACVSRARDDQGFSLLVQWFDQTEWQTVSRCSVNNMMEGDAYFRSFVCCSDGVDSIWALLPCCSSMLRYNIVSKEWAVLPSILDRIPSSEWGIQVFYTTL